MTSLETSIELEKVLTIRCVAILGGVPSLSYRASLVRFHVLKLADATTN